MVKTIKIMLFSFMFIFIASMALAEEYDLRFDKQAELKEDTEFSGTVYIKDKILVPKGVTLTIKPGTVIKFGNPGIGDSGVINFSMLIDGSIIAVGTKMEPIVFTSATEKKPGAFGDVSINKSGYSKFRNCNFEYSYWGIHVHDSNVTIEDCRFEDTFGGVRFKGDITIVGNEFIRNDTSLRFWMGSPTIVRNSFSDVGTAIFLREQVYTPSIDGNAFTGIRDYFIKMGELQDRDITVTGSDFGMTDESKIREKIYDKGDEDYIGKVHIEP